SKHLRTDFLVGHTPRLQQVAILAGALASAVVLGPILLKLNDAATVYVPIAQVAPGLRTDASALADTAALQGPQSLQDSGTYRVWHKTDLLGGPAGKYLFDESAKAVYLVDPGINASHTTRPDRREVRKYDAPKAVLMSYIIKGILDQQLPWALVIFGVIIALVLEMANVPSLPFAVGVYLPLSSSAPIFVGGMVRWLVDHRRNKLAAYANASAEERTAAGDRSPGVLLASGYIAGGALAGIAGGCSASFVSRDGLVMTNHHCAAACLAQLSSAKKNFIADGFLARKREEEVRCPEIEINRLEGISDVTGQVKGAVAGLDGEAFKLAKNAVEAKLSSACVGADRETARCDVVDLYHGGLYHLYRYRRFQDVRLAWAPELAIAFFGGDPDNFNFPRYDLDIALLRAYENDKPVRMKDFFPFSKAGAEAGEMGFVSGHPGSTQRQLTMSELETFRDVRLIGSLLRLAE